MRVAIHIPPRRQPLPLLDDVHPDARRANHIDLGLQTVPVAAIQGTTTPSQTRRDRAFMPLPAARGRDWDSRWRRLEDAGATLAVLPPVDLVQVGASYWVIDGHNRVALARSIGQLAIDANVTLLRWLGAPAVSPQRPWLAPLLEESAPLRSALARACP
jgi:hypothetical protein